VLLEAVANSSTAAFNTNSGAVTNATMSLVIVRFMLIYPAS
jgi:hypothetical protein